MGTTLLAADVTGGGTAAPVPVAFLGRTSTMQLQDPAASISRQYRSVKDWLPAGWFIAASFWDIESGGLDLEQRGHGSYQDSGVTVPRDGGLADLLAEAAAPVPRFAAVVCEDIERSGRDTFNALKLERQLSQAGVALFATDEPADIAGANATTVLVRRVKQGVAEWYRLQIREKVWKGLQEHSLAGWNIGPAPYGYLADKVPHPVAFKAAQGRTKTRLALDPQRAPVVAAIFAWRTQDGLGTPTITRRLNADPTAYPLPGPGGWTIASVGTILRNPKYTGHMVFGRRRPVNGVTRLLPPDQWLWSPEPTHPPIITRPMWDAAQAAGKAHSTSRDGHEMNSHPQARRTYPLRGRVRCRECQRRMSGITRSRTQPAPASYVYYMCPAGRVTDNHPATVSIREDHLTEAIRQFFAERVFGPDRADHLAAQIPATATQETEHRQHQAGRLTRRLRQIDAAEDAHAREIEALTHHDDTGSHAAVTALRSRLIARFTELETERATINSQLTELARTQPDQGDPGLLDNLPILGDILEHASPRLRQQLYDAFQIQLLYRHHIRQVTIHATITHATPHALAAIITASQTPDDASAAPAISDLAHGHSRPQLHTVEGASAW